MPASRFAPEFLTPSQLDTIRKRIVSDAQAGRDDEAWSGLQSLLPASRRQEFVAAGVAHIVGSGHFSIERALQALEEVYSAHPHSESVLGPLGQALDEARDIDDLNSPAPDSPLFENVVNALSKLSERERGTDKEIDLLLGLRTAARMMARQHDELAEKSARRLVELQPKDGSHHYCLGLFLKTRGGFRDGMLANQAAITRHGAGKLFANPPEAYQWNLGICATGAGQGAIALEVWRQLGQKVEMGRFGLPDGGYPDCKVKLAQRPLAERSADSDDPGLEETIWIERLSACHGIIRSVLYNDLGVDYGDVVLFDGAPITYHTYGEKKVPVFPHLATLQRRHYQMFNFAGTQQTARQLHDIEMEGDVVIYSHSENFISLCAACWQDPDLDHDDHRSVDKHVVTGRIAAPSDLAPDELLRQLDAVLAAQEPCRIYVPGLCEAAGFPERAAVERRRFEMITRS